MDLVTQCARIYSMNFYSYSFNHFTLYKYWHFVQNALYCASSNYPIRSDMSECVIMLYEKCFWNYIAFVKNHFPLFIPSSLPFKFWCIFFVLHNYIVPEPNNKHLFCANEKWSWNLNYRSGYVEKVDCRWSLLQLCAIRWQDCCHHWCQHWHRERDSAGYGQERLNMSSTQHFNHTIIIFPSRHLGT